MPPLIYYNLKHSRRPDCHSNESQSARRAALRTVRHYELMLSRTHARMLVVDASRTLLSTYAVRVLARTQAPLVLPPGADITNDEAYGRPVLRSIADTLRGLLGQVFEHPYIKGGAAVAGGGGALALLPRFVISPPLLETLHDLVALYASALRSAIEAYRFPPAPPADSGTPVLDPKSHLTEAKEWSTTILSLLVEVRAVSDAEAFNRFDLLERAPDFLPAIVAVLATLFDRLEVEELRDETDADKRAQTLQDLTGLQIFYLRSAADSFALLQPTVLRALATCHSTLAATSRVLAEARAGRSSERSARRSAMMYDLAVEACLVAQHPLVAVLAFLCKLVRSLQRNCRDVANLEQAAANFRSRRTAALIAELLHEASSLVAYEVSSPAARAFAASSANSVELGKCAMAIVKLCSSFLAILAIRPVLSRATGRGGALTLLREAREVEHLRAQLREDQKKRFAAFVKALDAPAGTGGTEAAQIRKRLEAFAPEWMVRRNKEYFGRYTHARMQEIVDGLVAGADWGSLRLPFDVVVAPANLDSPAPAHGWMCVDRKSGFAPLEALRVGAFKRAYAAHLERRSAEIFARVQRDQAAHRLEERAQRGAPQKQQAGAGAPLLEQPLRQCLFDEDILAHLIGNELLQWQSQHVHAVGAEKARAARALISGRATPRRGVGLGAALAARRVAGVSAPHAESSGARSAASVALPRALVEDVDWFWCRSFSLTALMLRDPASAQQSSQQLFHALNFARVFKAQLLKPIRACAVASAGARLRPSVMAQLSSSSRRRSRPAAIASAAEAKARQVRRNCFVCFLTLCGLPASRVSTSLLA